MEERGGETLQCLPHYPVGHLTLSQFLLCPSRRGQTLLADSMLWIPLRVWIVCWMGPSQLNSYLSHSLQYFREQVVATICLYIYISHYAEESHNDMTRTGTEPQPWSNLTGIGSGSNIPPSPPTSQNAELIVTENTWQVFKMWSWYEIWNNSYMKPWFFQASSGFFFPIA